MCNTTLDNVQWENVKEIQLEDGRILTPKEILDISKQSMWNSCLPLSARKAAARLVSRLEKVLEVTV